LGDRLDSAEKGTKLSPMVTLFSAALVVDLKIDWAGADILV